MSEKHIKRMSEKYKVSSDYVIGIVKGKGYSVGSGDGKAPTGSSSKFSLKDLEVPSKNTLIPIQKDIEALGYSDVADWAFEHTVPLMSCKADDLLKKLDVRHAEAQNYQRSGPYADKRAKFDNIIAGMKSFLEDSNLQEYIDFLKYTKVSDYLTAQFQALKAMDLTALNDNAYNECVDFVYKVIGSRDNAKGVVENFFIGKNIGIPRAAPNVALCPFCLNTFNKDDSNIQQSCPICHKSFMVTCPSCGKQKNLIQDTTCCGVDIGRYPLLLDEVDEARNYLSSLSIAAARSKLAEINGHWKNFPGTADVQKECEKIESMYGDDLKTLDRCLQNKEYEKAKGICEKLGTVYPKFKDSHVYVYQQLTNAEELFAQYQKEQDIDAKISLLLDITSSVSDFTPANNELRKYPVESVTDLQSTVDAKSGIVAIGWKSKNRPNSVNYIVRRSEGVPVANASSGQELTVTKSMSVSDNTIIEGVFYYYAVYASRGNMQSNLSTLQEPVMFLRSPQISVNPSSEKVSIAWGAVREDIEVYYSDKPITKYAEGTKCENVTTGGCDIDKLQNNKTYYFAVYKTATHNGKQYYSPISKAEATPMVEIKPPEITKALGSKEDEYIITHLNSEPSLKLEFYHSSVKITGIEDSTISIGELNSKLQKRDFKPLGDNRYSIMASGTQEDFIYPVYIRENSATVGNIVSVIHVKMVSVLSTTLSAGTLYIAIDKWPEGADWVQVCYNNDSYPTDTRDCDRRLPMFTKEKYSKDLISIPQVQSQEYFITIFAHVGTDNAPVCNCYFDNRRSSVIGYSFSNSLIGGFKITLKNESPSRPELYFCTNMLSVPLSQKDGVLVFTIPANPKAPQNEDIKIPGYKPKAGEHGKLFSNDKSVTLLINGSDKLK